MRKRERGAALVEFAIVFPLQLFVVLGLIQLALAFGASQVVLYSSYSSARAAIVDRRGDPGYTTDEVAAAAAAEKGAEVAALPLTWAPVSRAASQSEFLSEVAGQASAQLSSAASRTESALGINGDLLTGRVTHHYQLLIPGISGNLLGTGGISFLGSDAAIEVEASMEGG